MPIHSAGPRLHSSIPFKHLARKDGGGKRSANVEMNVTPLVDLMTVLVTFLLMVFSASGEILTQQAGLELPGANQQAEIQRSPVITITTESITFNNEHMAETETVFNDQSPQWKVVELFERLKQEKQLFKMGFDNLPESDKERCLNPDPADKLKCLDGLAILQADKRIRAKVINRVLKTANAAGYTNIMFAVERASGGAAAAISGGG